MPNFNKKQWPKNTAWALSAKGNWWRQKNGKNMVVGRKTEDDDYWVLVDGQFLDDRYDNLDDAQCAAESEVA